MNRKKYIKDFSIYSKVDFHCEKNTYITPGVQIQEGVVIWPNTIIIGDTIIGKNSVIHAGAIIMDAKIGRDSIIGQYTLLRNNVVLKNNVVIGPHSEISRSIFENNSGAYHKCVILDAHIKENVKLGSGVVTANTKHDGKYRKTIIEKNAKIGINVSLIAPIVIGANSWVGAGSIITKDVDANQVVISRRELKKIEWRSND